MKVPQIPKQSVTAFTGTFIGCDFYWVHLFNVQSTPPSSKQEEAPSSCISVILLF